MKASVNFSNLEISISVRVNGKCDNYHSYRREEKHVSSHNDTTEYENATADINLSLNGGIETDTPEELIKTVVDLVKETIMSQGKKSYVEKVTPDSEKQEEDEEDEDF